MPNYHPPFLTSTTYHIYNHANGDDNIFREQDNYRFFLEKYVKYINPVADTFAYCLMRNHFHLMIRIKDEEYFQNYEPFKGFKPLKGLDFEEGISKYISLQFSHFFNGYTQAYNKKYKRRGSLFNPRVKRKQIMDNNYYTSLIVYIHNNPVHHGFVQDIWDWSHSSYQGILEESDSIVEVKEILKWFGNKNAFIEAHKNTMGLRSAFD